MKQSPMILAALVLSLAGAAQAADPGDAPVATATPGADAPSAIATPAAPAPPPTATPARAAPASVAQQIDDFIRNSPAAQLPPDAASGVVAGEDEAPRKVHGVVDVSVGNHGYRSAYARSDLPLGKSGTLSIAVGETRFNGRAWGSPYGYGYGYGAGPTKSQSVAIGLALGDSGRRGYGASRCRAAWSDGRFGLDEMAPVAADQFSDCPYPPAAAAR